MPRWLQLMLAVVLVATFASGWATTAVVVYETSRVMDKNETLLDNNERLGECTVELLVEHRVDNRGSHEAMSQEHFELNPEFEDRSVEGLPPPPARLPRPDPERSEELRRSCAPYINADGTRTPEGW